ncbi:VanW family protein [Blastococcus haudaquaticus]|uniref:Vancomycin resistance protein YoaR, contains peptidoglycan-binding and VanW domains n=1 Tax=Blastococcus haudaquaticus TaxID=1938745 RepID=A0A286GUP5_9ACTN|nr:VanW family protein [Blastococcus haudaquaticus]SOD99210.1 Vancomycin resistance protein YoaR, contains peptidoglycan-binding and VanW domains [Blastococcus haudaquaticus]
MPQHPATPDDTVHDDALHDDALHDDTVHDVHDVHDATVRMRPDGAGGRPTPEPSPEPPLEPSPEPSPEPLHQQTRSVPVEDHEDTRPVTRDWLLGAPDTGSQPVAGPAQEEDRSTQALDYSDPGRPDEDRSTQALDWSGAGRPDDETSLPTTPVETLLREDGASGPQTPSGPPPGDEPPADGPRGPWWRRRAVLVPAGAVVVLAAAYGADLLIASGDIPRSTTVAGVDIGGLSPAAASEVLEEELAPRVNAEHQVRAGDVTAPFSPLTAGITLDVGATIDSADDQPLNPWTRVTTLFSDRDVEPTFTGEETALGAQIDALAEQVDRAPVDASIVIEDATPAVTEPADGRALDRDGTAEAVFAALRSGADPSTPIDVPVDVTPVNVDRAEAQRVLDETVTPALSAPVTVSTQESSDTAEVSVEAIAASLTFTPQEDGVLAVAVDPVALQTALGDELAVFGSGAEDARFDVSGGAVTIVPSVDGTGVAPTTLAEQLLPVLTQPEPRTVTAQLGPVPADFTTEEAQALGIKEEIGSFTTNIGNAASGTNIRVVAEEVDGAVVMPGETFSLNGFTGPRGLAQGYVEAGVINNGTFTTAVGGGISQFATTMFNAVFFSGMEDVFHKPHSYYISRYPAGREATVYYDSIDLKWRNDSDTGVYIDTAWTPGTITVTFYGTKRYEIESVSSDRFNQRSPVVQEKPDDGTCKAQGGSTGFDITVTRIFRDLSSGAEVKRENFQTRYAAEPVIRCIAAPEPEAPPATPGG